MSTGTTLTGSGIIGFLLALAYVGKLVLEWRTKNREEPRADKTSSITDAVSANAILGKTLDGLSKENARMAKKIKQLEEEAELKDRKIDELEQRLNDIADELSALKTGH